MSIMKETLKFEMFYISEGSFINGEGRVTQSDSSLKIYSGLYYENLFKFS